MTSNDFRKNLSENIYLSIKYKELIHYNKQPNIIT